MVFAGPTFLFLFLPLFIAGYYLLPSRARSPWILLGSWLFYGWWRFDFLALLVGSSLGAGVIGRAIDGASSTRRARALLGLGVAASLGALAYFKYFNFGVESLAGVLNRGESMLIDPDRYWEVVLPVGISFYTFQIISYMVDVYRGTARRADRVVDVAAYVSLFPQLVAGPIVRYSQIADQLTGRVHRWEGFSRGARRFALGLARKVLIADAVAPIADAAFSVADPGTTGAWIGLAAYSVQIYFDFAAYSDMAIGLGLMMGFRFPENFFQPYLSRSITEFWRRWHVTLSQWLRDYLYIPLGGNQRGRTRTLLNLMTVMVLGGLWHGAAWTFVAWGAWHGLWLIVERLLTERVRDAGPGAGRRVERVTRPWSPIELARRIYTLAVVGLGWVFFRAPTFSRGVDIVRSLFGASDAAIAAETAWRLTPGSLAALVVGIVYAAVEPRIFESGDRRPLIIAILFVAAVARLMAASYSPFLYFQF